MADKKLQLTPNKTVFYFDSIRDVEEFTDEVVSKVPTTSREYGIARDYWDKNLLQPTIQRKINSYGEEKYGTLTADFVNQNLDRYTRITDVESEATKLTTRATKYDFNDIDQVKKIEFTEMEIGVFSFDLASLGLIRVYEYYSPLLKEIVSPNLIKSEKTADGKNIYYYIGNDYVPKHEIQYVGSQGGYYSNILKRLVDKKDLIQEEGESKIIVLYYPEKLEIKKHEVERIQAKGKDGKDKFATTFKKCFINIPKIESSLPRVDIIVPVSYSWGEKSNESFWNSIAMASICERLTQANVDYRVIACYSLTVNNKYVYDFVNIKNENQPLDKNQLSLLVSDMRFFRVQMFRTFYASLYDAGYTGVRDFTDRIGDINTNIADIKATYIEYLSKQSSESDRLASQISNSKIVLPPAMTEAEALSSYNTVINQISTL
jgi:hypothetical protein